MTMNNYLRNECDKTFFAHERIICGTSDERASASFARMCLIRLLVQYFLKRTLCLIPYILCNRMALVHAIAKVSIEINSDLFSLFRNFHHPNWRNCVL
jgi:hypothetical protein